MALLQSLGRSLGLLPQVNGSGTPPGLPAEATASHAINSPFGMGEYEAQRVAAEIVEQHRRAKQARYLRDLTADKYLIHIDGEGQSQYVDIYGGAQLGVPPDLIGSTMLQRNLLRPLVDNMVAYHTAIEYRVAAEAAADKQSRDFARVNTLLGNHYIVKNRLNELAADALYLGAAYGYGTLHASWRDDPTAPFDPVAYEGGQLPAGLVDFWMSDPWDNTYNTGATRRSIGVRRYGRVLPVEAVKRVFGNVQGIEKLAGSDNISSASRFQRTLKRWTTGTWMSGVAEIMTVRGGEELVALVCEEVAPGLYPDFPQGRLAIAAVQGQATTDGDGYRAGIGSCMLLHVGPLPGGRFSGVNLYTGFRGDDILGAAYVKDLDDLQVQLNDLVSYRAEIIRRWARTPWLARAASIVDDTRLLQDDGIVEYTSNEPPQPAYQAANSAHYDIDKAIAETLDEFFRIGGWQAASRGESSPGDPAAKVVALARADDTIFGPSARAIQGAVCELLTTAHALTKQFMTTPVLLELTGDEWGHIADPWVQHHQLSAAPPVYRMTSGFGSTPEARAQQLLNLVGMAGADGTPLVTTRQFWQLYPDHSLRPPENDSQRIREGRAAARNYIMSQLVRQIREQYGPQADAYAPALHYEISAQFPIERSDDPQLHVDVLDQLVQNVYEDPLVRQLARWQQNLYYDFMNQIALQQLMLGQPAQPQPQGGGPQARGNRSGAGPSRSSRQPDMVAGSVTSNALSPATIAPTVQQLTSVARQQGAGNVVT